MAFDYGIDEQPAKPGIKIITPQPAKKKSLFSYLAFGGNAEDKKNAQEEFDGFRKKAVESHIEKLKKASHYLFRLKKNSEPYQPEIREAIDTAIKLLDEEIKKNKK